MYSSLFYNINVAASITTQGRSLVSTLGMFFESFLANNVKFGSLDEAIVFIHNVISETPKRKYGYVLDHNISIEDCFIKIATTFGYQHIPSEEELQVVWEILCNLSQDDINRLYYKNNLYEFILQNPKVLNMIKLLLHKLDTPYLNPNKCPKEIEVEIDIFASILSEFVFYNYHYIDRIDRMDNMIKDVTAISDTDSTIVSFDAWYNCILEQVKDEDFKFAKNAIDAVEYTTEERMNVVDYIKPKIDYDFFSEEVIEVTRALNPCVMIPQDNLRYSIINILAYCVDKMVNEYLISYCRLSNAGTDAFGEEVPCYIIAKNEFLFKRALLTDAKKNYATKQEIQEGNMIPENKSLDQKGLAISKTSLNIETRKKLEKILYEDILNADNIDRVEILKKLAIMEKDIFRSLSSGEKNYYKPVVIKALSSYEDPISIQGIKAAVAWNELCGDIETIDLRERNSLDLVKVNITFETAQKIRESNPALYQKIIDIVGDENGKTDSQASVYFKGKITSIGVPNDTPIPKWITEFINYTEIINDNLKNFPLESLGIKRLGKDSINYTNIVKI